MPDVSHSDMTISKTHVPTIFKWNGWGSNVELAGSFDSPYTPWHPIQMKRIENSSHFEITLDLQPNITYDYKFVVDNHWVLDPDRPKFRDSAGNENHQINVEAPKIASPPPSPMPKEPESSTIYEQEIEENNLKDDEHENQHDVKPEQQSIMDEVEETIEEIEEQKIVNIVNKQEIAYEQEIEEQNIAKEQETDVNIVNEQEIEEQDIVNEQEIEEQNIVNEQETEVNIVNEQQIEEQNIFNEQETEVNISNEQEIEEQNIVNEQETEEQKIVYEQEIDDIVNEQEIEEHEQEIVYEQKIEEQNIANEQETEVNIDYEQEIEGQNIVNEQEIEEQNIVNEQETEVNIVNEQEIEEQKIINEQEIEEHDEQINIVNEQETEEQKIIEIDDIVNEQEIEEQNIANEQETKVNIDYEQEIEEQEVVNIVDEQETEEQKIIYEQEIEKGSPNEISITAIKEATVEKADEINNITIEKEEKPIEAEEPVEKQEIIEEPSIEKLYVERKELKEDKEIIEKHQELSEESKTNVISNVFEETTLKADVSISLQTKTLENAIEEKSVDSGVESVVKTVVESVVESSDIPHTDKINNITNSLQPSQIIKEEVISKEIDTSKIIINETTSEIQVEEISETSPELNLLNESITETEVPSTTEASSITEVPSVTEVPSITEVSSDLIDKKVNEETTLPALDLTVTISNATIIDNTNNTDNTSHTDEIIGEKVEPHESTSDLMTENIIVEKESIVQELEENPMKETETFKEREVIDQYVISDTNEILSMSVEEIHKEYGTVQEQTLPRVLEETLEISSLTQPSPSINSSISEVSEVPKEFLTTTYEQISTRPENLIISHKTETNEVINNHDNLDNLENNITEQKVEEFVQANMKNELDTYDDDDTIVEENSNDVVSENLSSTSVKIIQESNCTEFHEKSNDSLEENVEKSIPVQDEEISKVKYDDWEVQIAENNTTDITGKSVDGTQANEQMPSPDESPDHEPEIEPEIEPINENEVHDIDNSPEPAFFAETQFNDEIGKSTWSEIKGLSVSTHEETISEEKLQGIDEINEVHAHMMDNKPELERSLNSLTSYENEEQSPDHDENSHHDNSTKMDNEAFIIKDTETETSHTENLNKVDKIYTISYDNVNIVSEIQNNLSISQKDSMTEDTKLHEFESLGKITTDNNLSDNLLDEAPGSSATACMTTTVFNSSDDDKSDSYLIPNEKNTVEDKSISKSTNGRKRGMTIFSPGESTKDINMVKSRHTKKNLKFSSSQEVVTIKKEQKYEDKDNDNKGNIFYLIASLVTTFVLGIISMLFKVVSRNRK